MNTRSYPRFSDAAEIALGVFGFSCLFAVPFGFVKIYELIVVFF